MKRTSPEQVQGLLLPKQNKARLVNAPASEPPFPYDHYEITQDERSISGRSEQLSEY
jgi:hypothetical protein